MTAVDSHEPAVQDFYDNKGKAAAQAYGELMAENGQKARMWFHGDRLVEEATGSPHEGRLAMLRWMADQARLGDGSHVLEFGPGTGGAAVELAAMTGAVIVGCGNVESTNQDARLWAAERGLSDRAVFTTVGDLDYKDLAAWPTGCFDAVTFNESLCHLRDRAAFFRAAYRILKPGGMVVGSDWIERPYGKRQSAESIAELINPVVVNYCLASLGTVDSYAQQMRDAGFSVDVAVDEYPEQLCLGSMEPTQTWRAYRGPHAELHNSGKAVLDAARRGGVFSVARWAATRPSR